MSEKRTVVSLPDINDGVLVGGQVNVTCDISRGRGADKVSIFEGFSHTLDLDGLTMKELIHLATATVVIKLQGQWRDLGDKCATDDGKVTNVHEYINRPVNRTLRPAEDVLLDKVDKGEISPEKLAELIAKLQEKAKK